MLFTGIQVAGPRLGPTTLDKGFHAIPPGPSGDPRVPACFYEIGDYTCVKDATAVWWDPAGQPQMDQDASGYWTKADDICRGMAGQRHRRAQKDVPRLQPLVDG